MQAGNQILQIVIFITVVIIAIMQIFFPNQHSKNVDS